VDPCKKKAKKAMFILESKGNAPDNRNFFVVVTFAVLKRTCRPAGIDASCVHHQRSLEVHRISPRAV